MDPQIMQMLQAAANRQQQPREGEGGGGGLGSLGPLAMMSPMAMLMSKSPNLGLGMIAPGMGIARALGAFK